jgi:arginine decarboxylase
MKVSVTSGKAEGPTKINAFDNALLDAGIGDINLIKVSSIISPGARIVELPAFNAGSMVNCVLAHATSNRKNDVISAVIAIAMSDDQGCVVEHSDVNRDPEEVKEEAIRMVKYMMKVRGKQIKKFIIENESHIVQNWGAVVAAIVYLG